MLPKEAKNVRLDRFITLNIARPWRIVFPSATRVLPVLMYHSISDRDESHLRDYFKVCTAPSRFREQMQTLRENGYAGVDLGTGLAWLNSFKALNFNPARELTEGDAIERPPSPGFRIQASSERPKEKMDRSSKHPSPSGVRPVVITFDDGFHDFYTEALPVMRKHGFTATMYLPTGFIGDSRRSFCPRHRSNQSILRPSASAPIDCLTWAEVKEARCAGMIFGSHTKTHPKLYGLPWKEVESELCDSRREIEDRMGEPIADFAYPYAFPEADREFCRRFRDSARAAGYSTCVTTTIGRVGPHDDAYTLRRLPMNDADDSKLLLAKLSGAYDWLAPAQRAVKRVKHTARHAKVIDNAEHPIAVR